MGQAFICVVQDGRIVERGRHEELLAKGGLYRDLYERQCVDTPPAPVQASCAAGGL